MLTWMNSRATSHLEPRELPHIRPNTAGSDVRGIYPEFQLPLSGQKLKSHMNLSDIRHHGDKEKLLKSLRLLRCSVPDLG